LVLSASSSNVGRFEYGPDLEPIFVVKVYIFEVVKQGFRIVCEDVKYNWQDKRDLIAAPSLG
jgi:hypothetical protein